jgi:hypothetical protein
LVDNKFAGEAPIDVDGGSTVEALTEGTVELTLGEISSVLQIRTAQVGLHKLSGRSRERLSL